MTENVSSAAAMVDRIHSHYIRPHKVLSNGHVDEQALLPGAVVLTEVPAPGTSNRRIDALVIGLTTARKGLDGFEIKVNRADWLKELDQPRKADSWYQHTHRWWVAAPSTAIVQPEELPDGWGLMMPDPRSSRRMLIVVKAATRDPVVDWPLLWELTKKLDRYRAIEVRRTVDAVRDELRDAALAQARAMHQLRGSEEARLGSSLVDALQIDELGVWKLNHAIEQAPQWWRRTLAQLLTLVSEHQEANALGMVLRESERLAEHHRKAADHLATVIELLADSQLVEEAGA